MYNHRLLNMLTVLFLASMPELKLLSDPEADMSIQRVLNAVVSLNDGEIDAAPQLQPRPRAEIHRGSYANDFASRVRLAYNADLIVSRVLPDELWSNPPFFANRVRLVRAIGKI